MEKQKKVRQFLNGQQRGAGGKTPDLSLPESLRRQIWTTLQLFNCAFETPGSGLDGYLEVTDVLKSVEEELEQEHDMRSGNRIFDLEEVVKGTDTVEALWVIERFYSYIGDAHKLDFQGTINKEFKEQKSNWRLVDGQFSRVAPEIVAMPTIPQSDERSVEKLYEEACDRFHQAQKNLEAGDYMGAVHNACESFEAVLKCLLERDEANSLGDEPGNHWLHSDRPCRRPK